MLNYDIAVIGGGIAGYCAALKALEEGKKTVLISQGQSALHFSSGSIDVLGKLPSGEAVHQPFDAIDTLAKRHPEHPYAKMSATSVKRSLHWLVEQLNAQGIPLHSQEDETNHYRITPLGTLKPTWLSQPFVHRHTKTVPFKRILFVAVDGYRDLQPLLAKDNLKKHPDFQHCGIGEIQVTIPGCEALRRNPNELRSIDIARLLKQPQAFNSLCHQLMKHATQEDLVIMPAIMGNGDGLVLLQQLRRQTNLTLHEVPTMPPSLLGIRIEEALQKRFLKLGGVLLKGDQVLSGEWDAQGHLVSIATRNLGDIPLHANAYILASGSYFSQGLKASLDKIVEPIFGLDMVAKPHRRQWRNDQFFSASGHPFMAFGVETDAMFRPSLNGQVCQNLYCCGSVLSGYDPVFEGSGGGVAVSTALAAVQRAMGLKQAMSVEEECVL
ncbi:TPA: glycerol-3-phosphate dehydrogenase subunit GlpB [Vibrio vulnificus]|uniref:glycerol-3-phosphate dehydrogenase subunit GlpB n=1 Tax=Vibrio vulnificus TaxID=672 RepID=UPI00030B42D9|nr:glycerol-3-phosphate dehydrogenase subunit GlpB [Vibrio vulnificus]HAS6934544.1 glycerol-3-phosphate dehydrogenase subunit GlpB [Vibrio vulnificus]HAS8529432.1 glycerol-3-phosphate dehydrogenase subunit GlpB [Vibrio vulnificus]